jgi:hypothetical protein
MLKTAELVRLETAQISVKRGNRLLLLRGSLYQDRDRNDKPFGRGLGRTLLNNHSRAIGQYLCYSGTDFICIVTDADDGICAHLTGVSEH